MRISKNILRLTTVFLTTTVFILAACTKGKNDDSITPGEDVTYAADHTTLEKTFDDVQSIADEAASVPTGGHLSSYRITGTSSSPCATITNNDTGRVITIYFGNSADGCLCLDQNYRKGSIVVNYTGNYNDSNSVHTITFDNYYVNGNFVSGTKTVTNMGHNALGQPVSQVTVQDGLIRYSASGDKAGQTITWNTTAQPRIRTWVQGYNTPTDWTDDIYQVTGNCTITRNNGDIVQADVSDTTSLIFSRGCRFIEAGTVNYLLPGAQVRYLNYGSPTKLVCDAYAILTINGQNYTYLIYP